MKESIAKQWIEALRSGKYRQAHGTLRNNELIVNDRKKPVTGFCCLGVLCNLHAIEHPKLAAKQTDPDRYFDKGGVLPKEVMKWAGLSCEQGSFDPDEVKGLSSDSLDSSHDTLVELNDSGNYGFLKLATFIEKNYKLL